MSHARSIGKYCIGRTIGEGTFAKVKLAVDVETNANVAIKIIEKKMVLRNKLMHQVKREISTMKLLNHPNIVKIYEVIASKNKIYLVMEYISGGQLSDKLGYLTKLDENEARKYFQQLIDAIDYCHSRGVYHRDLKPENLLLDNKGNLKVSDFGLSALRKPGNLLSTACGSPSYVAPEVIVHKRYDGASADIWSCGVVLFELLAGHLPFEDRSLTKLYRKISRAEYKCPDWFTPLQKKLIASLLEPMPKKRATIAEITEHEWFKTNNEPECELKHNGHWNSAKDDCLHERKPEKDSVKTTRLINAFQLIALSSDLDLSGLFHEQKTKLSSENSLDETLAKIDVAAKDAKLKVERMDDTKVKLHDSKALRRCCSHSAVSAEVIEVTPSHCVVEVLKSAGELHAYREPVLQKIIECA